MKRILLIAMILASSCLLFSCNKDSAPTTTNTSIEGTWELREASGMMRITYPEGNGNRIAFTKTEYQIYTDNNLVESGKYSIVSDTTVSENICLVIAPGEYRQRLDLKNNSSSAKTFFQLSPGKLVLVSGCFAYDAGSFRTYVPVKTSH